MKVLKGLGLIIVLFYVIGLFISPEMSVERNRLIKASQSDIFAQINDLSKWKSWDAWSQIDPNMKEEFPLEGKTTGAGAKRSWSSEDWNVGNGAMMIQQSGPGPEGTLMLKTSLEFEGEESGHGHFTLKEQDGGTMVTWKMEGKGMSRFALGGWMRLMFEGIVEENFDTGLKNLAGLVE